MLNSIKRFYPYSILLLIVILGYWQISFLTFALKWDFIDVVFPFRFYFSECIQSGYFPFWNPYQQTGTPFFTDLQAPIFYPELLFTSIFTGYGVYAIQFLFVIYTFIAAIGMYKLSYHFNNSRKASLIAGIAYSLSGYIIGHGQHFFLLVGAAWIPYVVVYYFKLNQKRNFINVLKTAVFMFLMVSGAYQALSFTLFYLIVLIFSYFVVKEISRKNFKGIIEIIKVNVYLLLLVIVFLLPLIVSTFEILSSVDRLTGGISLRQTLANGQTLKSIISFVLPFSTLNYSEFFGGVDVSMRNHYFGLIPLIFFIAALFQKRSKPEYLIFGFGLIIMASSFSFLPVREFMFNNVPFMNLFKYAAYIRVFGLLSFILLAADYFAYFQKNIYKEKKKIVALGIVFLIILFSLILYSISKVTIDDFRLLLASKYDFYEILKNMSFYQHVLVQAVFQFFIVAFFLLILISYKRFKHPFHLIIIVFIIEIFAATQLNLASTIGDSANKPYRMKKDLSLYPDKFPIPVNSKIIFNDEKHASFSPFWRNTYIFSKQITFGAFSSFELNTFNKLDDDYPNLKDAVLNNHLYYFSDTIFSLKQFADSRVYQQKSSKYLFFSDEDFMLLSDKIVATDSTDEVKILLFSPNKVVIETNTKNDQFFTMLQTNFKGWKAYIDNYSTPIYTSNFNYRTIFLTKGNHTIIYEYKNNKIIILYFLSNILFFITTLLLLGYTFIKSNYSVKAFVYISMIIILVTVLFLIKRLTYTDNNYTVSQIYNERWSGKNTLFHITQDFDRKLQGKDTENNLSDKMGFRISSGNEYFPIASIENKKGHLKEGTLVVTAKIFTKSYFNALIVSNIPKNETSNKWHASKIEKQIENLNQWNEITYYRNFYELEEDDVIEVFLWNLKKSDFIVNNITVDFYPFIQK